jgi:hypothetical protein
MRLCVNEHGNRLDFETSVVKFTEINGAVDSASESYEKNLQEVYSHYSNHKDRPQKPK